MNRMITPAVLALMVALGMMPAAAQEDGADGQDGYAQQDGMAPSAAVKRAMQAMPGAQALGVKRRGGIYVVRLKQDGTIIQVGVDPATGDVFPLD